MSPLDLIFEELETGMRFMERGRGREAREERPFDDGGDWGWVRIAEPRDAGGGLRAVELPRLQGGGREDPEVDHH